jgi:hypothetical protein
MDPFFVDASDIEQKSEDDSEYDSEDDDAFVEQYGGNTYDMENADAVEDADPVEDAGEDAPKPLCPALRF